MSRFCEQELARKSRFVPARGNRALFQPETSVFEETISRERERNDSERERSIEEANGFARPLPSVEKGSARRPWVEGGMQIETGHEYSNVQLVATTSPWRGNRHSFPSIGAAATIAPRVHHARASRTTGD